MANFKAYQKKEDIKIPIKHDKSHNEGDFLPDLCAVQAVFSLVLVAELLAFAFVLIESGFKHFNWLSFGFASFLIQWIVLSSAAFLCPLRPWFKQQSGLIAGSVSYGIVLLVTLFSSIISEWVTDRVLLQDFYFIAENMVIAAIFAGVVLRYFYIQQQLQNREQAAMQSHIQALQSRIHPHFLFNSMNSIASLIAVDPDKAEDMVVNLSQLFRASLSEPGLVPLAKEIELCRQFGAIEQARLGERLTINWEIGNIDPQAPIPSLLVQPLIENAIYHGIEPLTDGGVITVNVVVDEGQVVVRVSNPCSEPEHRQRRGNGIALENIRHRLKAHFGVNAELHTRKAEGVYQVILLYKFNTE